MRSKNWKNTIILFFFFMIYKLGLEYGYWYVLRPYFIQTNEYVFEFDLVKYILSFAIILLLFFLIDHDDGKVSTFFIDMHYVLAIIPLTVIYAFGDKDTMYYISVCICYLFAIILLRVKFGLQFPNSGTLSTCIIFMFVIITIVVYFDMILENGIPSLKVLNIFEVYNYRADFKINKYIGYMYRWQIMVINPFMIVSGLHSRKYLRVILFSGLQFITYLYSTQKTVLFIIPLIFIIYYIGKMKHFFVMAYGGFSVGIAICAILGQVNYSLYKLFSLFGRRVLLLPANFKFFYYDFFSTNDLVGLSGTLWGKLLDTQSPYDIPVPNLIAEQYLGRIEASANTGFLAEGYYRFGYFGIILSLILFAFLLKCLDLCSEKNGYAFTLGISIYSVFMLNDTSLIDSLIFGNLTILLIVLIFYESIEKKTCKCKGVLRYR